MIKLKGLLKNLSINVNVILSMLSYTYAQSASTPLAGVAPPCVPQPQLTSRLT